MHDQGKSLPAASLISVPLLTLAMLAGCGSDIPAPASGSAGTSMQGAGGGTAGSSNGAAGSSAGGSAGSNSSEQGGTGGGAAGADGGNAGGSGGTAKMQDGGSQGGGNAVIAAGVRWVGRVDLSDPSKPKFNWSGSGFVSQVTTTGASLGVNLNNAGAFYFVPVVDGKVGTRISASSGMSTMMVPTGGAGAHKVELYRETEASKGLTTFLGVTGGTLGTPPPGPGRLVEIVGDSITAGYGNLQTVTRPECGGAAGTECHDAPALQSEYSGYATLVARALGAEWSVVAMSGWGLWRDLSGNPDNVLPKVYEQAAYAASGAPVWDFKPQADAVVINLGTNDTTSGQTTGYKDALKTFIGKIRGKYPNAWIFPITGSMMSDQNRKLIGGYMQTAITELADPKIFYVDVGSQDCTKGTGCDWHPTTAEHQRIADVLAPKMKEKLGW